MNFTQKLWRTIFLTATIALLCGLQAAHADYVGETQNTKYFDKQTRDMIAARYQSGQGLVVGDELSYIIQFTPYPGGTTELIGGGAYVTDYIPAGTQVVNAQFVQYNASTGAVTQISPPSPAEVAAELVPQYSETGIFYSTDPRTAFSLTGYAAPAAAPAGVNVIHNSWDAAMSTAYSGLANPTAIAGCPAAPVIPVALLAMGSPVTGPDAYLKNDSTGAQGPWHRISYAGSMIGTLAGTIGTATPTPGCIGGTPTSAGWPLSSANPLPSNVNAIRFAAGKVTVGQLFSARITLRLTQPVGVSGIVNRSEVFGGDVSILNTGALGSKSNIWKYIYPSVANSDSSMTVVKSIVGMCSGVGCVPQPYSGGTIPSIANLKLRYEVTYLNSAGGSQSNVVLSDVLPTGGLLVAGSETIVGGANILPTTPITGGFQFQPMPTLGSGSGGTVRFDVNFATAPPVNVAVTNTAKLTSTAIPSGVTSSASATPQLVASLNASKTTSTANVIPGGVASYTITIPNNGAGTASAISVADTLPSDGLGTAIADRFSYQVSSATATFTSSTGVVSTVTPVTATVTAPTVAPFKELVTFTFPAGTTIPSGAVLTVNFNAVVGSNMPASSTAYLNDVSVPYTGGTTGAKSQVSGVAPVTVIVPMSLTKSVDCVWDNLVTVCTPYSSGAVIPTGSRIKYRLDYANTSSSALANVQLTDTLATNTSFVVGTAAESGTAYGIVPPTVAGQVITFLPIASLPAGATGTVKFDAQLAPAAVLPSGSYITNNAKITSTAYPGGVTASVTNTVGDAANLVISKTTTTPTIAPNGTATYQITVTNTGSIPATAVNIYDFLPFTGTVANANLRFNYLGTTSITHTPNGGAAVALAVTPTTTIGAANVAPHNANVNQQQVLWNFSTALPTGLGAGGQLVITFTAQPFATPATTTALPTSNATSYYNDIQASYTSLGTTGTLNNAVNSVAPVQIPVILSLTKSIDCVWNTALTSCDTYTTGMSIPANAKVRYQLSYQNLSNTLTQTNVVLSDVLPAQTAAGSVSLVTLVSGTTPPTNAITPASPLAGGTFTFATIPTLAPLASGVVKFDVLTNAALGTAAVTNTAKIISAQDGVGVTGSVTHSVPVNLSISKTIIGVCTGGLACTPTAYTTGSGLPVNPTVQYQISYTNTSTTMTQTNVMLCDTLPTQTGATFATTIGSFTSSMGLVAPTAFNTAAQNTACGLAGTQNISYAPFTLAPGATATVTYQVALTAAANAVVLNTGKILSTEDTAGRTSAASTSVTPLTVTKIISCVYSGATCTAGSYVTGTVIPPNAKVKYQVTYANPSAAAVTNVTICDQLPAQNSGVFATTISAFTSAPTALTAPTAFATAAQNTTCALTGTTNIAYAPISIPAASSNVLTYDVQTTAVSGNTVVNTAKLVSGTLALASTVSANVGAPNVTISKSTSASTVNLSGTATYTITIKNTGNAPTASLKVYDFLPYSGTVLDATKRFTYAATSAYTGGLPTPTITSSVAPTISPYSSNVNQQQVLWDFGTYALPAGATVTITFTATVGSAMPAATYGNSAMYEYTSLAGAGSGNVNATALVTVTAASPSLLFLKTVTVFSDPVNGAINPKFIPGAVAAYTLNVINSGAGSVDNNTTMITDPIPNNVALFANDIAGVGSGPILFTQGTPTSGLTYTYTALNNLTDDVDFSKDNGATWSYVPAPGADGCDPLVTNLRINPKGTFVGNVTPPQPSFTLNFRVCIK